MNENHENNQNKIFGKSKFFLKELETTENLIFSKNIYPIISIIMVSIGFICLLIYNYKSNYNSGDILIIKASTDPIKVKPLEPGGKTVQNIDKLVYNNLLNNRNELPKVERILPLPEKPMDIKVITNQNQSEPSMENIFTETSEGSKNLADHIINQDKLSDFSIEKKLSDKIHIKKLPESHKSKIKNLEFQDLSKNNRYRIQLASFKTEKEAINEWKKIKSNYPQLLEKLEYYIHQKEIEGKGVYYRLQVGPLTSDSDARILCKKLNKVHQACIVIKN